MKKIFITGGSGFVGSALCKTLAKTTKNVCASVRSRDFSSNFYNLEYVSTGDIRSKTNWKKILTNIDCIIHCVAKAHETNFFNKESLNEFRMVNVEATANLARQAAASGVKRFVFLSSIKVNGENNINDTIFRHDDPPNPKDAYGISKFEAEQELWKISKQTGIEVVIIRPPLVYGRGVKGYMKRLIKLINYGIPLPLSLINNKRSLIGIDNLVDIIIRCIDHPNADGKTFLVSDDRDLSTPDLLKLIASYMGSSVRLFPLPVTLLKFFSLILGMESEINKLIGSLRIDNSLTKEILNWKPPFNVEEGIRKMVDYK